MYMYMRPTSSKQLSAVCFFVVVHLILHVHVHVYMYMCILAAYILYLNPRNVIATIYMYISQYIGIPDAPE